MSLWILSLFDSASDCSRAEPRSLFQRVCRAAWNALGDIWTSAPPLNLDREDFLLRKNQLAGSPS